MAAPENLSSLTETLQMNRSESSFHTIPDAKNASSSNLSVSSSSKSQQPDESEIRALNDKLISAINLQTTLDDKLSQTRHELEESQKRIAQLEAEAKAQEEKFSSGLLISKDLSESQSNKFAAELAEERKQKNEAVQEKHNMQTEVETLTASLFDEANKLVAKANMDRDALERKNLQLHKQIKDDETLLASQSEQLLELKEIMHHIQLDGTVDDTGSPRVSDAPSSPGVSRDDTNIARLLEAMNISPTSPETGEVSPAPSTSYSQLLKPMCRSDVPAYEDFKSLVHTAQKSHAGSRMGSGNYNVPGLGLSSLTTMNNGSSTSINQQSRISNTPAIPGSFSSPMTDTKGPTPLKDTKFFKRIMTEDVEPTLRLDLSQSISWLQRRTITSAFADSSLIVEPIPEASRKLYGRYTPCSLCGENRKENQNSRTHRMRVNEDENATKWPVCVICLEKVRGVGDLVGYVRMIRDGVVKCGDKTEELEAWDELIRLRERLFWARMAGGVIPSFIKSMTEKNTPIVQAGGETAATNSEQVTRPQTPSQSRTGSESNSEGTTGSQDEAALQLQKGLDESLTTFDNMHSRVATATPPSTPPPQAKRESGGFQVPKISIPKSMPSSFWSSQVNVLR